MARNMGIKSIFEQKIDLALPAFAAIFTMIAVTLFQVEVATVFVSSEIRSQDYGGP